MLIVMRFLHTVFFWLKNPQDPQQCKKFKDALYHFMQTSTYANDPFIGRPAGTSRDVVDGSFTYSLSLIFDSEEKHGLYQNEPAHLEFLEVAAPLWERVAVYDSLAPEY
ncbi:MAG: Dabb family protein [Leeuwenhoekiella sp.]